ncbi:MAG: nitroreductase family deazaflavin-dependent oxidoreductase [Anaerolineales bacterium]|nr:nitroreductase family deazaflavin-dependent oxidoreductase [Anaerolineales bacterium]
MTKKISPPKGLMRLFLRFPIILYRIGLGGLLGKRFLLLNHIGRKTGLPRQAVLEVVRYDRISGAYIIVSGFGPKSQWRKNLLQHPEVTIQVGRRKIPVRAECLTSAQCGEEMVRYARRYPKAARSLSKIMGFQIDGSEEAYQKVGEQLQFFALIPRADV